MCALSVLAAVRSTEGESKSVEDVDRLAELLEQADLGETPETEEAGGLLSLASELRSMAPPAHVLSEEAEDRIFAKFMELAPEAAPEVEPDLAVIAEKLSVLAEAPAELTDDVADRIFSKIEQAMPELQLVKKRSRLAAARASVVAALPRPMIQRKADELAAAIESVRSGRQVRATGELAAMLTAVSALRPVPAIEPSPSFVDWLAVRLMSPANQIEPAKEKISEKLAAPFRSGRFQAGLAGAAAVIAAVAAFNLGGSDLTQGPRPDGSSVASPAPVGQADDGSQVSQGLTPIAFVPTNPAPARTSTSAKQEKGSGGSNNSGTGLVEPGDPNVEEPGSPPSSGIVTPASDGRDLVLRLDEFIRGDGGN